MIVLIFFLILVFIFWNKAKTDLEREFIYEYSSYIIGCSAVLIYLYLFMDETGSKTHFYYLVSYKIWQFKKK